MPPKKGVAQSKAGAKRKSTGATPKGKRRSSGVAGPAAAAAAGGGNDGM